MAHVTVGVFHVVDVVTLLHSLRSLLPKNREDNRPRRGVIHALLSYPKLAPSTRVPRRGVTSKVMPRFGLSVHASSFCTILTLIRPLCHRTYRVLSLLPTKAPATPSTGVAPRALFSYLPLHFAHGRTVSGKRRMKIPTNSISSLLGHVARHKRLIGIKHNRCRFGTHVRAHAYINIERDTDSTDLRSS